MARNEKKSGKKKYNKMLCWKFGHLIVSARYDGQIFRHLKDFLLVTHLDRNVSIFNV